MSSTSCTAGQPENIGAQQLTSQQTLVAQQCRNLKLLQLANQSSQNPAGLLQHTVTQLARADWESLQSLASVTLKAGSCLMGTL